MAIKAQKVPPGKLRLPPQLLADWLRAAAEALADRLRRGRVPKRARREARALLVQAFEALESGEPSTALFLAVDAAGPPGPRIPRAPSIGQHPRLAVLDRALVQRVFEYESIFDRIAGRAERFLAATGRGTLSLSVRELGEGPGAEVNMELTEG